ncbi:hypothetical protein CQW23_20761 [Capsicum baccatum]|nr:hypothetical protein CQW23_20761 [Capsicum baccatum]
MELDDWKWKAMEIRSSGWDDSDTSSSISKRKFISLSLPKHQEVAVLELGRWKNLLTDYPSFFSAALSYAYFYSDQLAVYSCKSSVTGVDGRNA